MTATTILQSIFTLSCAISPSFLLSSFFNCNLGTTSTRGAKNKDNPFFRFLPRNLLQKRQLSCEIARKYKTEVTILTTSFFSLQNQIFFLSFIFSPFFCLSEHELLFFSVFYCVCLKGPKNLGVRGNRQEAMKGNCLIMVFVFFISLN